MQSVQRELITTNDKGRLCVETVQLFRNWLVLHGCTIRETGAGQFFQVKTVHGWAPVQKGRKGVVVTPVALRGAISRFKLLPTSACANDSALLMQDLRDLIPASPGLHSQKAGLGQNQNPAPSQYLSDLRDDFALHAPLVQAEGESLRDYALRRWEYAKVMVESRPAMYGD